VFFFFCSELETAGHLLFGCLVAQHVWSRLSDIFNIPIGSDFLYVVRWWISNDKNGVLNIFSSAVLWSLWTLRNEFCFQGRAWSSLLGRSVRKGGYKRQKLKAFMQGCSATYHGHKPDAPGQV
jgi:hypothetical protein